MKDYGSIGRVGIAAPASAPSDEAATERGLEALRKRGLDLRLARGNFPAFGYLAGSDAERAIEINELIRDPDIRYIFCARGGYGTLRILDRIDYDAARTNRPVVVGYSDVTALQLALYNVAGIPSISGPMVAVEWGAEDGIDPQTESLFWRLVTDEHAGGIANPHDRSMQGISQGTAEGTLLGGNLAVLTRLVGTPYFPDCDGAILFIEDVGEPPYRVDGCLAQLRHAGVLQKLAGVVIGEFSEFEATPGRPSLTLDEVFAEYFGRLGCPVAANLAYGHIPCKTSVPIGVRARLAVEDAAVSLSIAQGVHA